MSTVTFVVESKTNDENVTGDIDISINVKKDGKEQKLLNEVVREEYQLTFHVRHH